jgi:hypothetical protein
VKEFQSDTNFQSQGQGQTKSKKSKTMNSHEQVSDYTLTKEIK